MTKQIQLTKGQVAIVDDWWYEELNQYKWYATHSGNGYYAERNSTQFGKKINIYMHAVIAGTPKGFHTDHINHNTLDNREENLRVCTASENLSNRGKQPENVSGYKGVSPNHKNWQAQISFNGKRTYVGTFRTAREAALAYDAAARRMHGEFANTNFTKGEK